MRQTDDHYWGIILAGGEGKRLREFTKSLYGHGRPKQFCAFTGTRSMLRHTVDRSRLLISSAHLVTVICRDHLCYAAEQLNDLDPANIIALPSCRGNGSSILFSLLHVLRQDPHAIVSFFPSDHFILDEQRFMDLVRNAFQFIHVYTDQLVILGAPASYPETEYGWIEPAEQIPWKRDASLFQVRRFWEKPHDELARTLFSKGCLWNTFVVAGRAERLLRLFQTNLPRLSESFQEIVRALGTSQEEAAIEHVFEHTLPADFSSDLLQRSPYSLNVLKLPEIHWSDWGNGRRILKSLGRDNLRTPVAASTAAISGPPNTSVLQTEMK